MSSTRKHSTGLSFKRGLTGQVSHRGYRCFVGQTLARICSPQPQIYHRLRCQHCSRPGADKNISIGGCRRSVPVLRTPTTERNTLIDSFKAGDFSVLVNCGNCLGLSTAATPLTFPLQSYSPFDRGRRHSKH
ncbi:hypothetical protein BJV74DRAFT_427339 [Russula compacta]|nr:hypothetical protein BJV74DRAFT_427339 [Russula compacta]